MKRFTIGLAAIILVSCNNKNHDSNKQDVVASNMDTTIDPSEDFFLYANGGWIKKNPIPAEQSSWGIGNLVIEENQKRLREICEKASLKKSKQGSSEQLIGDFWYAAMDTQTIEKAGLSPIQPYLKEIEQIQNIQQLLITVAHLKEIGSSTMFSDFIGQDAKNSNQIAYQIWQGGIGLSEREYYFRDDSATEIIRMEYKKHISRTLSMSGIKIENANKDANEIFKLETALAKVSRKMEDLRDPYLNYNKLAVSDLQKKSMNIHWTTYMQNMGVQKIDSIIIGQPEFIAALDGLLKNTSIDVWKAYLRFNLINDLSPVLPDAFGMASFEFSQLLSGAKVRKPRWKRMIQIQEDAMGELMGQQYVKEFFNETAKKRYSVMVDDIKTALRDRIKALTWMSAATKEKAFSKLSAIKAKVGYPDHWKDFSGMKISRKSLADNYIESRKWWHKHELSKLGKPVDRTEWDMYPQTYNAYYNSSNNEIVLPAGIFTVPGYRDEELDDAVVYGYAGASTIGHEITHGFDDEGRQFDAQGNLVSWWLPEDETAFNKKAEVMVNQFNDYEPVKGYHINGSATLGENIADLGGVLLGLEAFKKTKQYKENKPIAGLTPKQRYYLGYSLGWLGHIREEQLKNRLLTDVHSPANYRVNGPFASVDDFYQTFKIRRNSPMYRPDSLRVKIW
jgi:putative endopeptidase